MLSSLKVGHRIYLGFALTLALLGAVAFVGTTGLKGTEAQFGTFSTIADISNMALDIDGTVADMRRNVRDYGYTGDEKRIEMVHAAMKDVGEKIDAATRIIKNPEWAAAIKEAAEGFKTYSSDFERIVTVRHKFDKLIDTQFYPMGSMMRTKLSELIASSMKAGEHTFAAQAGLVQQSLTMTGLNITRYIGLHDMTAIDKVKAGLAEARAQLAILDAIPQNVASRRAITEVSETLSKYTEAFPELVTDTEEYHTLLGETLLVGGRRIAKATSFIKIAATKEMRSIDEAAHAGIASSVSFGVTLSAGAFALGLMLAWLIARSIITPVRSMTTTMTRLAAGDKQVDVPALNNRDEIGDMGRAVQVFKENAIEVERLAVEQEELKRAAATDQRRVISQMASNFETSVKHIVETVSSASTEMQATAGSMSATAEETARQAEAVACAANDATANVQTVAAATEELSASVGEIGRQVNQSNKIAQNAVIEANQTNQRIQGLAQAVAKIGEVVNLINDIASQTNLLALNATIEAARAGDAGKGFAVVANEVKNLANQTAKATDEISSQINAVQVATHEAVGAIDSIGKTIGNINEIASAIAAAVEEQGAATQEIARNVSSAASGTQEVSSNIGGVTQAASETGMAANQVLSAAGELSRQSEHLRAEVQGFLTVIKDAGDRRRYERVTSERNATVSAGGSTRNVRLRDISVGGARLGSDMSLSPSSRAALRIDGASQDLEGTVIASGSGELRLEFPADSRSQQQVMSVLKTLGLTTAT